MEARLINVDPDLAQVVGQVVWGPLTVVRQEKELVAPLPQPFEKVEDPGDQAVAVIDDLRPYPQCSWAACLESTPYVTTPIPADPVWCPHFIKRTTKRRSGRQPGW